VPTSTKEKPLAKDYPVQHQPQIPGRRGKAYYKLMAIVIRAKLTNEIVDTTQADALIEDFYPDRPLIISFAFVDWNGNPGFDFFGRIKKLESACGEPINKIYVRDRTSSWYQNGIPGLGSRVPDVAMNLNSIVHHLRPNRIITIGQSMGAYAALLFGLLLRVDQIVTFGGLSAIDARLTETWNDHRYLSTFKQMQQVATPHQYLDLVPLLRDETIHGFRPTIDAYFGTFPSDVRLGSELALNEGTVHVDALHAERIAAAYPNCRLYPHPNVGHLIAQHLVNEGKMDSVLRSHILGDRFAEK
jgi:hypothetical protein